MFEPETAVTVAPLPMPVPDTVCPTTIPPAGVTTIVNWPLVPVAVAVGALANRIERTCEVVRANAKPGGVLALAVPGLLPMGLPAVAKKPWYWVGGHTDNA